VMERTLTDSPVGNMARHYQWSWFQQIGVSSSFSSIWDATKNRKPVLRWGIHHPTLGFIDEIGCSPCKASSCILDWDQPHQSRASHNLLNDLYIHFADHMQQISRFSKNISSFSVR
jgi:hypothetical protein